MKMLTIFTLFMVSLAAATMDFHIKTVHNIDEFKSENPDVKLEKMYAYDHVDQSRSYTLGNRQTGEFAFYASAILIKRSMIHAFIYKLLSQN